ncbi:MAG: PspC domain-containing protein [Gordonia sp. (in: high G+C Gram-positive bacteria)]|uniref:PspC domain-containing protein n=1 Tax=Gordonia sp. (in: high G+C Gram-positive bacteria) TaxID=84139 RepID=UPI0039E583CA
MNTETLSDLWATRPVRRRDGHKVAGVCSGFGARYDVDPTLIRVAFVVATFFGGSGVLLYIAAVIALPYEHGDGDPLQYRRRSGRPRRPWGISPVVLWILAAVVFVSTVSSGSLWSSGSLAGLVLMALGWWLLYQRTPVAPAGTGADEFGREHSVPAAGSPGQAAPVVVPGGAAETAAPAPGSSTAETTPAPAPTAPHDDPVPPAWDPLGVAPFAWDLPEPTPAPKPPAPKVPASPVTPITLGVAVLVAVAGAAAHLAGAEWFTVGRIASLALAVIGVGLLIGALQRRPEGGHATGLITLAFVVAGIVVASTLTQGSDWSTAKGGIGERRYHVTEQSQLRERYDLTVGNTVLDLRDLDEIDRDTTVTLNQNVGEIKVQLPPDVRVRTECDTTIGDYVCPEGVVGGPKDGPILTIDARMGVGHVEMKR